MRIKLKDSAGKRSRAEVTTLDAIIRYLHQDGTEFFFERTGPFEYTELPSGLADRIKAYLHVMKKKASELMLKEVDDLKKIEKEERNAKKSTNSCDDHTRMGRDTCPVVVPDEVTDAAGDRPLSQSEKDDGSGEEVRGSGSEAGQSDG